MFPTSFAQQRLLLVEQLMPGTSAFHIPAALRLRGPLDTAALAAAVDQVAERHEALRTVFLMVDGEAVQLVEPDRRLPVAEKDAAVSSQAELVELLVAESEVPFDLDRQAARVTLFRLGPADHVLALTLHHTVADLWSCAVFFRELAHFYSGGEPLPELEIQYVDYAIWQRDQLTEDAEAGLRAYWRESMAGAPHQLVVPGDRARPAEASLIGGSEPVAMPAEVTQGVLALARELGATPFMVLLATWDALLGRWTGQHDLVVATGVATRTSQVENLIGCFINVLLVRASADGDPTFAELVDRVGRATLDAVDHQDLPFDRLVDEIAPGGRGEHQPLTQVMFNLQNAPTPDLRLPGLEVEAIVVPRRAAQLDLTLDLWTVGDRYEGAIEYSTDIFAAGTIRSLWDQYVTLLAAAVADPRTPLSRLPLQDPAAATARVVSPAPLAPVDLRAAGQPELVAALDGGPVWHSADPEHPASLTAALRSAAVPAGTVVVTGRADGIPLALPAAAVETAVAALTGPDGLRANDRVMPQPSWSGERMPYAPLAVAVSGATVGDHPTVFLGTAAELAAAADGDAGGLRLVVLVGEPPGPELLARLGTARVRHLAGPLEAALGAALVADGDGPYQPVAGIAALVLDAAGQIAARGQPGELHLWGPAVALASPRLVRLPTVGGAAVRTGLTARYVDGGLDVGAPTQLDGRELDLAAITDLLAGAPSVTAAAVRLEDGKLVAWHAGGTATELAAHLAAALPAGAVPTEWIAVDRLPTRADGSVDTHALPRRPAGTEAGPVDPRDPVETVVTDVWGSVLGTTAIGVHDDFFILGGHSIAAMQVAALLGDTLGVQVPVRVVLTETTPATFAAWLRGHGKEQGVDLDAAVAEALAVGDLSDDEVAALLGDDRQEV